MPMPSTAETNTPPRGETAIPPSASSPVVTTPAPGTIITAPPPGSGGPIPSPNACVFDTHTILMFQGRVIESITARGKLYNFEANGTGWPTNGMDLTQVPYFASGPCAGKTPGTCHFDTRTFAMFGQNRLIEFVTANGKSWAFENGVATDSGTDLSTVPRYAEICALRGGAPCRFDTRTFVNVDGQLTEAITAYGRYFAYDLAGRRSKDSGVDLSAVTRYAAGPCKGQTGGSCKLETRTYGLLDGKTVEVVTAYGNVYRYNAAESSFAEIQPSGIPLLNVPSWAGGPCK